MERISREEAIDMLLDLNKQKLEKEPKEALIQMMTADYSWHLSDLDDVMLSNRLALLSNGKYAVKRD